ncbi:MAG: bifunctional acetate--CoA ligase family protein/GNAT family N-acetyltransferase [Acidovorax sp.]|uniref:bifunctional acetate--CoA ligase family protein/GNAT family N-acetyltransferase n=1 Tax=Acidovorax sp. TaxID=1872122 RepID=UPI0025B7C4BE|nr:bifunctional acetate--CoA ligase family protein/GNAT family N-acetyltransferase [Acidovorax sp.]MCE1191286.1 bifunctional acetate--CoA ligase family protein/GNAT family N-acetyltransferase [Acidovorax sp.]
MDKHFLQPLFNPASIVVFAGGLDPDALEPGLARTLADQLRGCGYTGELRFVDIRMSGTLADLARSRAELAVIALPTVDEMDSALEVAGRIRCRAALVVSSGLNAQDAARLHATAQRHQLHLLGPNCNGFQRPHHHLNASVIGALAKPGPLGLLSQSGALTASTLDWAQRSGVGFSAVVSLGPNTALDLADALDFLAADPHTHSIVIYMEGIRNARRFMSALRAAASAKPVIVLKAGRKPAGNEAALTHSGAIVGSDDVFDAALRRAGAVRVRTFSQLFSAVRCLASRYQPSGRHLAVITNGGGPGVLAADWANELRLQLGKLDHATATALAPRLSPQASLKDLIDLSEDATPEHFTAAIEAASATRGIDGILVIYSPKLGSDPTRVAQALVQTQLSVSKPLFTCWMGDSTVNEARAVLNAASIPTFRTPEAGVDAFSNIANHHENQLLLQQTPPPLAHDLAKPDVEGARLLIESVLAERRYVLTELESKALLAAFHIPVTKTILARNAHEAMMIATQLGYPAALKIDSPDISHKSDVQGVALNLPNATQVRDTYNDMVKRVAQLRPDAHINGVTVQNMSAQRRGRELYIGLVTDDLFGPVITFGAGGTMIELIGDRSMEMPPLNQFLARGLVQRARVAATLGEWRGAPPVDMAALEHVLLRVSEMVCELPQLREMDINPIILDESGALAVDARIVVQPTSAHGQHYGHLAILPYPSHFEQEWPMRGGGLYTVRPVRPDDASMLQALVKGLSSESRYFRFASSMPELPSRMLARFTLIDYDREMALVAVHRERKLGADGEFIDTERIIGVSRYVTNPDLKTCEFSLLVADEFAGQGLGSRLMAAITEFARNKGLAQIEGLVLAHNSNMLKLMRHLGFQIKHFEEDPDFKLAVKVL